MRYMLREVASGIGVSYESLSRDYSQSNYSSSRLALLDDRDLWRYFQAWFIRSFREPLHRLWVQQAVLGGAIPQIPVAAYWLDRRRYEAVRFRPRGWAWIDPEKEAKAAILEIRNGLDTRTAVISRNGVRATAATLRTTTRRASASSKTRRRAGFPSIQTPTG
jgi:lambda family phage portal protein